MPALPADIIRATRPAKIVTDETTSILTAHPNARDQAQNPAPGYFESATDAATVLDGIATIVSTFRRRFVVEVQGVLDIDPLTEVPIANLIDTEHNVSGDGLMTRISVDLEREVTTTELLV